LEGHLKYIAEQLLKLDTMIPGLARALIRKAKSNHIEFVANITFENFEFFSPVINDATLYFKTLSNTKWVNDNKGNFISLLSST